MERKTSTSRYVAAIDIGTTKIVAIIGERLDNGKPRIINISRADSKGVKRGMVLNIEETVNAIQTVVEAVQLRSNIMLSDVFVGIAGQHIRSIRNSGYIMRENYEQEIVQAEIERLINDQYKLPVEVGEEIIHVLPQTYAVDNEIGLKSPNGMIGRKLAANFHIVIGQTDTAKKIEKCISRVGLRVNGLILEPLASAKAVLTEDEKEAGVALVDIGGGTTDLAVFYDNIIRHTAVIPYGGNVITNDIKECCNMLYSDAEKYKIEHGSAFGDMAPANHMISIRGISGREERKISLQKLAYIIQYRMEEIIAIIQFELEASGYAEKLGAGIVLTGGGALLKHLPQLIKYKTGMDVKIGYPSESLLTEMKENVNHPMYSTAIGLILQGYDYLDRKMIHPQVNGKISITVNESEQKTKKNPFKFFESLKEGFASTFFLEEDKEME